jgi:O-antigen ligase
MSGWKIGAGLVSVFISAVIVYDSNIALGLCAILLLLLLDVAGLAIPLIVLSNLVRGVSLGTMSIGKLSLVAMKPGDVIILFLFIFFLVRVTCTTSHTNLAFNRLDLLIICFVALHLVSLIWASDQAVGGLRIGKLMRNLGLFMLLKYQFQRNFAKSAKLLVVSTALSIPVVLASLLYAVQGAGGMAGLFALQGSGGLDSANPALSVLRADRGGRSLLLEGSGNWLLLSVFLVGGWFVGSKGKSTSRRLAGLAVMAATGWVLLSLERGTILGLTAGIVAALAYLPRETRARLLRRLIIPGILLVVVLTIYFHLPDLLFHRFQPAITFEDPAVSFRLELWKHAWNVWLGSPLVGAGVGSAVREVDFPTSAGVPHNMFLQVLSELGIIGFAIFICLLATWAVRLTRTIQLLKRTGTLAEVLVAISIFAGMIAYVIPGVVQQDFYSVEPWIYFAVTSAMLGCLNRSAEGRGRAFLCKTVAARSEQRRHKHALS